YYTLPTGNWQRKGSATAFGEDEWRATLARTLQMDELIRGHVAILDRYDPQKRIALAVDEWGTWYDKEPGPDRGALDQQNTPRAQRDEHVRAAVGRHAGAVHRCDRRGRRPRAQPAAAVGRGARGSRLSARPKGAAVSAQRARARLADRSRRRYCGLARRASRCERGRRSACIR